MHYFLFIQTLTTLRPAAVAKIQGDTANPVRGYATFYNTYTGGVVVQVEVLHLPDQTSPNRSGCFGMHIHETGDCTPPFDKTGMILQHSRPETPGRKLPVG